MKDILRACSIVGTLFCHTYYVRMYAAANVRSRLNIKTSRHWPWMNQQNRTTCTTRTTPRAH
eukprot:scaffold193642_cov21-Tisochrysis_lutea.AAC.1